jgi:hypothetical protein
MFRTGLKIVQDQVIKDFLIALFFGVIFAVIGVICFAGRKSAPPVIIQGKELKNTETIQMVYKGQLLGDMKVGEFKALLDASENYSHLLKAEDKQTLKIELEKSPWEIEQTDNTFETYASIVWYNDKKEALKKIRFRVRLMKKDGSWRMNKADELYTEISRKMFPTMSVATIILIIILIILL